jgi:hypothetical protein
MPKKELGNWISSHQKEVESVKRVIYLLSKYFPLSGIEETKYSDNNDIKGIDLILFPNQTFTDITGFPTINVQVKSSETGLDGFLTKGKKINGENGKEWRERRLVVLNATWHEESLLADFVAQVGNLMGIYGCPEMDGFVEQLDPYVKQCYHRTVNQDLLRLFKREDMYAWVAGRSGNGNYGR